MSTPPQIDIDALTQPVPGDDPSGGPLPFEVRKKLDDLREDIDPERDFDPEDPRRNEVERKIPNWGGVIDLAQQVLTDTSKDLLVAVRLTEALTMRDGFAGVRDGLRLLRRLVEDCWDRLRPPIAEEDDVEVRAGMFNWLDDPVKGALYPSKLRAVPLVYYGATPITFLNSRGQGNKPAEIPQDQVATAARAADADRLQNLVDDIGEALGEVEQLGTVLGEKMPSDVAPSFYEVRRALDDCKTVAEFLRNERGGDEGSADGEGGESAGGGGRAGRPVGTRDEAYEQLRRLAETLERLEPHSPVPYLIRRAVELRTMRFPELVDELTRDGNVLSFLRGGGGGGSSASEAPSE